jgi:hypothetical protein
MASIISAGTASNTAVSITGDTTGVLALATNNGTTALTIDTSQRVGIGTASPGTKLQVQGGARLGSASGSAFTGALTTSGLDVMVGSGAGPAGAFQVWDDNSLATPRFMVTRDGNVGIGLSTTNATLHVQGATTTDGSIKFNEQLNSSGAYNATPMSGTLVALKYNTAGDYAGMGGWSIGKENGTDGNYSSYFGMHTRANGGAITERARIDSAGNLLVGTTSSATPSQGFVFDRSTDSLMRIGHANGVSTGSNYILFAYNSSTIGAIVQSGTTAVAYNTSSDYRLKNTITPMTGALAKVAQLKPVTYKWNVDDSDGEGFIAHELQEVCPHAVTGEKDDMDADGNPKYQGIDTSFLVATLTAAIQELKTIVDAQAVEIAALKAKVGS